MKLSNLYNLWRAGNRYLSIVGEAHLPEHLREVKKKELDDLYLFIKEIEKQKTHYVAMRIERDVEWNKKTFQLEPTMSVTKMIEEE